MPSAEKSWPLGGAGVGLIALLLTSWVLQPWTLDDAYISFRYADNFAAGAGFVYNPGELVEGYTTFLWVFLLGVASSLGLQVRFIAKALGLLSASGTVLLVSQAWRIVPEISPRAAGIAAALLGSCGIFSAWAMPGMEVPLVALLLTLTSLGLLRELRRGDAWVWGIAGALAMMARPDSVVVVGVCAVLAAVMGRRRGVVVLVGIYGPYFLWRFVTYGWLFPNTFYAKVGSTEAQLWRGLAYVGDGVEPTLALLIPLVLGVFIRNRVQVFFLGSFLLHGVYVITVGGDVMPAFRFFAGVLPLAALGAGMAVAAVPLRGAALGWVVCALGFHGWEFAHHPDLRPRILRGVVGLRGEEVGLWLREHVREDALLATNTAGSVPYFSGLRTIDMLGLNDAHIAHVEVASMGRGKAGHEKADGAYVFARKPDIVQFGSARGRKKPAFRSDRQLARQPGFRDLYRYREVRLPSGARAGFWVKRSFLADGWSE